MAVLTVTPTDLVPVNLPLCQKLLEGREEAPTVEKEISERGGREEEPEKVQ